jgi:hypothetical protein
LNSGKQKRSKKKLGPETSGVKKPVDHLRGRITDTQQKITAAFRRMNLAAPSRTYGNRR